MNLKYLDKFSKTNHQDKDFSSISQAILYKFTKGNLAQGLEQDLLRHYKSFKANQNILLSGNTEILTLDIRKDKTFKELFNEYRKK